MTGPARETVTFPLVSLRLLPSLRAQGCGSCRTEARGVLGPDDLTDSPPCRQRLFDPSRRNGKLCADFPRHMWGFSELLPSGWWPHVSRSPSQGGCTSSLSSWHFSLQAETSGDGSPASVQRTLPRLRPFETRLKTVPGWAVSQSSRVIRQQVQSGLLPEGTQRFPTSAFLPQAAVSLPLSHPSVLSGVNPTLLGSLRSRDTSSLMSQGRQGLRDL